MRGVGENLPPQPHGSPLNGQEEHLQEENGGKISQRGKREEGKKGRRREEEFF